MARSISVKIPTALLISQVENKVAGIKEAMANYPDEVKKYEADYKAYRNDLVAMAIEALINNPDLIGEEHDKPIRVSVSSHSSNLSVQFDTDALGFPKQPEKPSNPNQKEWIGRDHISRLELLEKNLKILRMTSQEEVNASTYGAIMDLM